jgi:hypothetical protein
VGTLTERQRLARAALLAAKGADSSQAAPLARDRELSIA